jgi:hypothetical protein
VGISLISADTLAGIRGVDGDDVTWFEEENRVENFAAVLEESCGLGVAA